MSTNKRVFESKRDVGVSFNYVKTRYLTRMLDNTRTSAFAYSDLNNGINLMHSSYLLVLVSGAHEVSQQYLVQSSQNSHV